MKRFFLSLLLLNIFLLLSACSRPPTATPTGPVTLDASYTRAADTVVARFTQDAISTLVAQLTEVTGLLTAQPTPSIEDLPMGWTATPGPPPPPTFSPEELEYTPTPTPTPIVIVVEATPVAPCNWAALVSDVTISAGTVLSAGDAFTKVWRFRNAGNCTWTPDYRLQLSSGNPMGFFGSLTIGATVPPGGILDLAVDLVAPEDAGRYRNYWWLSDPQGSVFGIGEQGLTPFWIDIQVVEPIASRFKFDFVAQACNAGWTTGSGSIPCTLPSNDERGSISQRDNLELETRTVNDWSLLAVPNRSTTGWISGVFPAYRVQRNDHFLSEVSCLYGYGQCDVTFQLDYQTWDGIVGNIGAWREVYDNRSQSIDVDLSFLEGATVQFILRVYNNGRARDAQAVWFLPRIEQFTPARQSILTWTREGGDQDACDFLEVYLTGNTAAEARASTCETGDYVERGVRSLTVAELNRLLEWVRRIKPFNASQSYTPGVNPITIGINFLGNGSTDASAEDIQVILDFSKQLFEGIAP